MGSKKKVCTSLKSSFILFQANFDNAGIFVKKVSVKLLYFI